MSIVRVILAAAISLAVALLPVAKAAAPVAVPADMAVVASDMATPDDMAMAADMADCCPRSIPAALRPMTASRWPGACSNALHLPARRRRRWRLPSRPAV
jgi:hypothetical protein